jgi:hypothetical protein
MIERLQRAFEHIEELSPEEQEEIAELIEQRIEPLDVPLGSLAGSMPDLPDDAEVTLLRWRREAPPTPPMEEQLRWVEEE